MFDRQFEVDRVNTARLFTTSFSDRYRIQLVWNAIALHTTAPIAHHKQSDVSAG